MADDFIRREDVLVEIDKRFFESPIEETSAWMLGRRIVREYPAADVRPVVRGRWLNVVSAIVDTTGNCSECRKEAVWRTRNKPYTICPNCGADMREADNG